MWNICFEQVLNLVSRKFCFIPFSSKHRISRWRQILGLSLMGVSAQEDGAPWCILASATEWAGWLRREDRLCVLDWFFSYSRCPASFCGSIAGHPGARISYSLPELQESCLDLRRNRVACSNTKSSFRARLSRPGAPESGIVLTARPRVFQQASDSSCFMCPSPSEHFEQNSILRSTFEIFPSQCCFILSECVFADAIWPRLMQVLES